MTGRRPLADPAGEHSARLSLAGVYGPPLGVGPGSLSPGGRRDGTVPAGPRRGRSDPSQNLAGTVPETGT